MWDSRLFSLSLDVARRQISSVSRALWEVAECELCLVPSLPDSHLQVEGSQQHDAAKNIAYYGGEVADFEPKSNLSLTYNSL